MKKMMVVLAALFTVGMLAVSCNKDDQKPNPTPPTPEQPTATFDANRFADQFAFYLPAVENFVTAKLTSEEVKGEIYAAMKSKDWEADKKENKTTYIFSAKDGDQEKFFIQVGYVHTPQTGAPFIFGATALKKGFFGEKIKGQQILNAGGFTLNQKEQDSKDGKLHFFIGESKLGYTAAVYSEEKKSSSGEAFDLVTVEIFVPAKANVAKAAFAPRARALKLNF